MSTGWSWTLGLVALCTTVACGERADDVLAVNAYDLTGRSAFERGGDWLMAGFDAQASFHNSRERQLGPDVAPTLELRWTFDATDARGPVGPIHATPVVVGERTYVGDMFGQFFAIDAAGDLAWRAVTQPAAELQQALGIGAPIADVVDVVSSPIIGGAVASRRHELVVFGDASGNVYGLDMDTGEVAWMLPDLDGHPLGGVGGNSLLLLNEDTVVVGFSSFEHLALILDSSLPGGYPCCSHTGRVVAIDVASGEQLWTYETLARAGVDVLPAALAPFELGPSGADVWGQPSYDPDSHTVFVGTGQNLSPAADGSTPASDAIIALDAATGAEKWKTQMTSGDVWIVGVPNPSEGRFLDQDFGDSPKPYRLPNGRKVIGAGQKSGTYHVLDRQTGELLRSSPHLRQANSLGGFQSGGGYAEGRVFQHGLHGLNAPGGGQFEATLLALSRSGARVSWRFTRPASAFLAGLAIADGVVYVVNPIDEAPGEPAAWAVYGLNAKTGAAIFHHATLGRAISSPVVSRGRLYVSFGNSALDALGLDYRGGIQCFAAGSP